MVIHAEGGTIDVSVSDSDITMILADRGPGIPDIDKAMQEGYSHGPGRSPLPGFGAGMGLPNMKRFTDEMQIDTVIGKRHDNHYEGVSVTPGIRAAAPSAKDPVYKERSLLFG